MTKFKFFIGGYFGTNIKIELKKDELCFFVSDFAIDFDVNNLPTHIISIKNDPDWNKLSQFFKTVYWNSHYDNTEIMDGTQWEIVFRCGESQLKSYGSNAYPAEFKKFIRLLNTIIKKHNLQIDISF